jgi:glycine cleavage system H protein
VHIDGKIAYVGITDYAQHSLGDITYVQLPKAGEEIKQASYCATVESVKAVSEVYAPLSGRILALNPELVDHPELINQYPYEKGYFFSMEFSNESEKANLIDASNYERYIEGISK